MLQTEDINTIWQSKDGRTGSNAFFKCGVKRHFAADCTSGIVDITDDTVSFPTVGKMQTTLLVTGGVLKLPFKNL